MRKKHNRSRSPRWVRPGVAAAAPACPDCGTAMVPVRPDSCFICFGTVAGGVVLNGMMYPLCAVHLVELEREVMSDEARR